MSGAVVPPLVVQAHQCKWYSLGYEGSLLVGSTLDYVWPPWSATTSRPKNERHNP